ncbi:hypothetical protein LEN26_015893 [Aphanomyces euteiches]|nr:hypothetical protein LEN26_015893 [Aphanomyces euteiches]KAH9126661.1 hypothetical protein AeMF1_002923 [Aphanomyces euteiches]KAH9192325.1 hypothetical protein AeNC1_005699 [Aphanomyces euteiches]
MFGRIKAWCGRIAMAMKIHMKKLVKPRMRGETFRKWVGRNIDNSLLASSIDIFQVFLGLLVTIIYFNENWNQFNPNSETQDLKRLQWVISAFFTLDYAMRFYAADSRYTFFWSAFAMVDLITILPQWLEVAFESYSAFKSKASAMKTLRALRFLRAYRLLIFSKTAKGRQGGVLFLTVMSIIICTAGVIQAVESCDAQSIEGKNCQTLQIYNACYFVVITIATLGYGDIAPKSPNGKVCVIFLIFFTGILLPLQISRYSDILNRETEYDKAFTEKKEKNPHILICGEVNSSPLDFFLRQFLHPNNFNWKDKVVILCPGPPSHNLKRILLNSAYEQRVMYLQGSAMLDSDLKRAGAANARLCFVMLNKLSADGDRSDTASNLLTISLRHHTKRVPLFVQVLKTDNIRHVHLSGASNIVCIDQLKLGLLAKACIIPGLCALLCNILFTFRPFYKKSSLWTSDFLHGCAHDVYEAKLPPFLDGLISFSVLANIIFSEFHVVMLGVTDNLDEFHLFPSRTKLFRTHTLLVLAKIPDCTRWIESINLAVIQKYQSVIPEFPAVVDAWNGGGTITARLRTMRKSMSVSSHPLTPRGLVSTNTAKYGLTRDSTSGDSRVHPCDPDDDGENNSYVGDSPMSSEHDHDVVASAVAATDDAAVSPPHQIEPEMPKQSSSAKVLAPVQVHDHYRNLVDPNAATPTPIDIPGPTNVPTSPTNAKSTRIPDLQSKQSASYTAFLNVRIPPDLSNHIILCGMPNMLHDFVAPLRPQQTRHNRSTVSVGEAEAKDSDDESDLSTPIVIISQINITEKQHASIAMFEKVYYLRGSPLHETVLREASVFLAKSIVILSTCTQSAVEEDQDLTTDFIDQNMIDTDAITLHRFITEACESNCPMDAPLPTVIIELSRPSSLRFLKDDHFKTEDAVVAQEVKTMTKQVLSRADDPLDNVCHPLYAAGKVCVSNFLDALLGSCNSYGTIIDLFHLLILGEPQFEAYSKARMLTQIAVPNDLWGVPYGQIFGKMLTQHDMLSLGLYRSRGNGVYFVFINPPEDVLVTPQDKLFVIR